MARLQKSEILDRILEGCRDAGWGVLVVEDAHPFRLHLYRGDERHHVRVYAWNLTHGGGTRRPADEYRIQITGIENEMGFLRAGVDKVVILGWWDAAEVFAGFDFSKHAGPLGSSPSMQIREETLRRASVRSGIATQDKGNGEIVVAFVPTMLPEYVRDLENLHGFGDSPQDREVLEEVAANPEDVAPEDVAEVTEERKRVIITVAKTLRDSGFTNRVLAAYSNRCAFCDLQMKLIDAAHILPVAVSGSDATSNGIALCALHHRAYDRALVTLNEEYQVLVNEEKIAELRTLGFDGGEDRFREHLRAVIRVPPTRSDQPSPDGVREANRLRGWP